MLAAILFALALVKARRLLLPTATDASVAKELGPLETDQYRLSATKRFRHHDDGARDDGPATERCTTIPTLLAA